MSEQKKTSVKQKEHKEPPMWLIGYNLLSGCLWSFVFLNVFATYIVFDGDMHTVFRLTRIWTTVIQCFAVIEIYNAATGIVKSPFMTTLMQVSSRLLVVLGIWTVYPESSGNYSIAYLTVHFAWGVTEVIRYYYYANHLISQQTPAPGYSAPKVSPILLWLRYNGFLILYPLGISSECYMIYCAIGCALLRNSTIHTGYALFLCLTLISYIPGTIVLFSHMLAQRKKFMRSLKEKKENDKDMIKQE